MAAPSCTSMMTRSAPGCLEGVGGGVGLVDDAADLDVGDAGRADERRQVLGHGADEAHLDAVGRGRHPGAAVRGAGRGRDVGERVGVVGPLAHVGREVLPVGAALGVRRGVVGLHDPVDQVGVARVELVVAGRGDGEAGLVEHVEGGLVVLDEGLEGRGTDHVAGGSEDRVRVRASQLLHRTRHDGGDLDRLGVVRARRTVGEPTVEVVGREDLDVDRRRRLRRAWPSRRRRGGLRAARSAWSRERICDRIVNMARVAFPWGDV